MPMPTAAMTGTREPVPPPRDRPPRRAGRGRAGERRTSPGAAAGAARRGASAGWPRPGSRRPGRCGRGCRNRRADACPRRVPAVCTASPRRPGARRAAASGSPGAGPGPEEPRRLEVLPRGHLGRQGPRGHRGYVLGRALVGGRLDGRQILRGRGGRVPRDGRYVLSRPLVGGRGQGETSGGPVAARGRRQSTAVRTGSRRRAAPVRIGPRLLLGTPGCAAVGTGGRTLRISVSGATVRRLPPGVTGPGRTGPRLLLGTPGCGAVSTGVNGPARRSDSMRRALFVFAATLMFFASVPLERK